MRVGGDMSVENEARQILEELGRCSFLAFVRGLDDEDRLALGEAVNSCDLFTPEQWQSLDLDLDISTLRRTVGSYQWLDNLADEQWQIIKRDILPVLQREDLRRDSNQAHN